MSIKEHNIIINMEVDYQGENNITKYGRKWLLMIACGVLTLCCLIGLGISEIVIYTEGTKYIEKECGSFPQNMTSITATKNIWSQWHWKYEFENGKIEQVCPTVKHSVNIFYDGKLVSRSDGKIFSTVSETTINDCNGKKIYTTRTGGLFQTVVNGNKIMVSYELHDKNGRTLAYVEGKYLLTDKIEITSTKTNKVVAKLSRNKWSMKWKWEIEIIDPQDEACNPISLLTIAGQRSFGENEKKTDGCNNYFFGVAYFFLVIGVIIVMSAGFVFYGKVVSNE
jgi:uncharacterized protein YxjI